MSQDIIQNLNASKPDRIASGIHARRGSAGSRLERYYAERRWTELPIFNRCSVTREEGANPSDRSPRNHRRKGLEVHLSLSTIQATEGISSAKFSEGTIDGATTYLYLHNLGMELKGEKCSPIPCTLDSTHKTFGPTDLTSTYSVCTLGGYLVASGNEPRPSGLRSDALTSMLPMTHVLSY
ncbi:hypothetical protein TNCV_582391 [Trichonephila clavipes]|nr:hypothetical protein TNCV_582391 [Trichonephila clavipes]